MKSDLSPNSREAYPQFRHRHLFCPGEDEWSRQTNEIVSHTIELIPTTFSNVPKILKKVEALVSGGSLDSNWKSIHQFGEDFYCAYYQSSGALTQFLGPKLVLNTFRTLAPIWRMILPDDYEVYCGLGDEVSLYRGGVGPRDDLMKGLSWTLFPDYAGIFLDAEGSLMLKTIVPKADLLVYLGDLQECIIDPEKLTSVEVIHG